VGGLQGISGHVLPFYDTGVLLSVALLGLGVLAAMRLPAAQGAAIVALFGWIHGNAHGAEMTAGTGALTFALGFLGATAILHGLGIAAVLGLKKKVSERGLEAFTRAFGVACLLATCVLWIR
jgi:urease accessory protein